MFLFDLTLAVPFPFSSGCSRLSPHVSHHNELKLPVSLVTLARRPEGELDKWRHWDFSKTFTAMIEVICFLFIQKMLKLHPIWSSLIIKTWNWNSQLQLSTDYFESYVKQKLYSVINNHSTFFQQKSTTCGEKLDFNIVAIWY